MRVFAEGKRLRPRTEKVIIEGMKEKKKLSRKQIIAVITAAIAVPMIILWAGIAYISVNSVEGAGAWEDVGTRFVAHRGYSALYFDNTTQAFEAAAKESFFQGIETDVRMTSDGVFVCSHDDNPFLDKSVSVAASTYDEIKNLPLDTSGSVHDADKSVDYRICTLQEFLLQCSVSRKTAFIEIKQDFDEEEIVELVTLVNKYLSYRKVVYCGFNKDVMGRLYRAYPYYTVQLFTSSRVKAFFYTRMGYNIAVRSDAFTVAALERAHKAECYYAVYTVNDPELIKKLVSEGADYVITDTVSDLA